MRVQVAAENGFDSAVKKISDALNSAVYGHDVAAIRLHSAISNLVLKKCEFATAVKYCLNKPCKDSDWSAVHNDLESAINQLDTLLKTINDELSSQDRNHSATSTIEQMRSALTDRKKTVLCELNSFGYPLTAAEKEQALAAVTELVKQANAISTLNGDQPACKE